MCIYVKSKQTVADLLDTFKEVDPVRCGGITRERIVEKGCVVLHKNGTWSIEVEDDTGNTSRVRYYSFIPVKYDDGEWKLTIW